MIAWADARARRDGFRFAARRLAIGAAVLVAAAVLFGPGVSASPGDGTLEPNGRGLLLLGGREAVLVTQSDRAHRAARARAWALYRLLRFAVIERQAGASAPHDGRDRLGGRAVALATAVLARDLDEARLFAAELDRVRAERASLGSRAGGAAPASLPSPPPPSFLRPVDGALETPFGVGRDAATGAWIFRAAARYSSPFPQLVRSPADGRVVRVARSAAGGVAVVLTHDQDRWTTVVSGLESVAVAPGDLVRRGVAIGRSGRGAGVRIETWRGRTPIDPASVLRAR